MSITSTQALESELGPDRAQLGPGLLRASAVSIEYGLADIN